MKWLIRIVLISIICLGTWLAWVVVTPNPLPSKPYSLVVGAKQSFGSVAQKLASEGVIRNAYAMILVGRITGADRQIKSGMYEFDSPVSLWQILKRIQEGRVSQASITILEGWTFKQFRAALAKQKQLSAESASLNEAQIMQKLGAKTDKAEGQFFPSTYFYTPGSSDFEILRLAYRTQQQKLQAAWEARDADLPYKTPYDLLIMASLIEKETSHEEDRKMVASVFVNRLKIGMRLQTDPTIIYGMGDNYRGNIRRSDLRTDTPYNTYTRTGLTPTPISMPGAAALDAASKPAVSKALYFVARGDGTSHFSTSLSEHNAAVRKFILKKGN